MEAITDLRISAMAFRMYCYILLSKKTKRADIMKSCGIKDKGTFRNKMKVLIFLDYVERHTARNDEGRFLYFFYTPK